MTSGNPARGVLVPPDEGETISFDWGQITWIASGALGNAREMTFGVVLIKSGCRNAGHWHPNSEEILHLLSGRLAHAVNDETFSMEPGDTIVIPAGAKHHAATVGEQDAVMLVFYPTGERKVKKE